MNLIKIPGGKDKRNMKKLLMITLLMGVVSFGCQEQVITQLEVGRGKLFAGLSLEAVQHLERAELEEETKLNLAHF